MSSRKLFLYASDWSIVRSFPIVLRYIDRIECTSNKTNENFVDRNATRSHCWRRAHQITAIAAIKRTRPSVLAMEYQFWRKIVNSAVWCWITAGGTWKFVVSRSENLSFHSLNCQHNPYSDIVQGRSHLQTMRPVVWTVLWQYRSVDEQFVPRGMLLSRRNDPKRRGMHSNRIVSVPIARQNVQAWQSDCKGLQHLHMRKGFVELFWFDVWQSLFGNRRSTLSDFRW